MLTKLDQQVNGFIAGLVELSSSTVQPNRPGSEKVPEAHQNFRAAPSRAESPDRSCSSGTEGRSAWDKQDSLVPGSSRVRITVPARFSQVKCEEEEEEEEQTITTRTEFSLNSSWPSLRCVSSLPSSRASLQRHMMFNIPLPDTFSCSFSSVTPSFPSSSLT